MLITIWLMAKWPYNSEVLKPSSASDVGRIVYFTTGRLNFIPDELRIVTALIQFGQVLDAFLLFALTANEWVVMNLPSKLLNFRHPRFL